MSDQPTINKAERKEEALRALKVLEDADIDVERIAPYLVGVAKMKLARGAGVRGEEPDTGPGSDLAQADKGENANVANENDGPDANDNGKDDNAEWDLSDREFVDFEPPA